MVNKMNRNIEKVNERISSLQECLREHKIYSCLDTEERIVHFMTHHVFCVWDFMNLLKSLQNQLTCTQLPWKPYKSPRVSRLINDIVLEEESDVIDEETTSHFSYYLKAINSLSPNKKSLMNYAQILLSM